MDVNIHRVKSVTLTEIEMYSGERTFFTRKLIVEDYNDNRYIITLFSDDDNNLEVQE